jgi:hypothetical protein
MWPFSRPKITVSATTMTEIGDVVHDLSSKVRQLREDFDDLADKHERLRGKFYGLGLHKPSEQSQPLTKSEILARHFTPGRPVRHTEG